MLLVVQAKTIGCVQTPLSSTSPCTIPTSPVLHQTKKGLTAKPLQLRSPMTRLVYTIMALPLLAMVLIALTILSAALVTSPADAFSPHSYRTARFCHQQRGYRDTTIIRSGQSTIKGPPQSTKPDYSSIHSPLGQLVDSFLMSTFRRKLSERLSQSGNDIHINDSKLALHDFVGIVELATTMNSQYNYRTQIQEMARDILISLFPPFKLDRYPSWTAKLFPEYSTRMCA